MRFRSRWFWPTVRLRASTKELQLFGQFVGSRELEVVYHGLTGERTLTAEWHFA